MSQSVVDRVSSLPLVSSTYGLVTSVYSSTKEQHPYLRTVCEAAEHGVRSVTAAALSTASPLMGKLEPQSKSPPSVVRFIDQNRRADQLSHSKQEVQSP